MEKIEYRAVIKFLTKQGKSVQNVLEEMESVYGDSCLGKTMVYKWHSLFKQGRTSLEDDPRAGRSIEVTTPEIVQKVELFYNLYMYLCFLNIEMNINMLLFSCSHTLMSTILFFIHPFAGLLEEISFEISSAFVLLSSILPVSFYCILCVHK